MKTNIEDRPIENQACHLLIRFLRVFFIIVVYFPLSNTVNAQTYEKGFIHGLSFQEIDENLKPVKKADTIPSCIRFCIKLAKGESELMLFKLTSSIKNANISSIVIDDLQSLDSDISASFYELTTVGYISVNSNKLPSYPDPLPPLTLPVKLDKGEHIFIALEIYAHHGAQAGNRSLKIDFMNNSSSLLSAKIDIEVYNFALPERNSINSHMFNLDLNSIRYWYDTTSIDADYYAILNKYYSFLEYFRIESGKFPRLDFIDPMTHPTIMFDNSVESESYLRFQNKQRIDIKKPKYENLGRNFSIHFKYRFSPDSEGTIFSYTWKSRKAGMRANLVNDNLIVNTWVRHSKTDNPRLVKNKIKIVPGKWDTYTLKYSENSISLKSSYNSSVVNLSNFKIVPAYGADFYLQSTDKKTDFQYLNWRGDVLNNIDNTYLFSIDEYLSETSKIQNSVQTEDESVEHQLKYLVANNKKINRLIPFESANEQKKTRLVNMLNNYNYLHKAYIRLPHDEQVEGERGDRNIKQGKEIKSRYPDLNILHSFGALGGRKTSKSEKLSTLKRFSPIVDIYSIRPRYTDEFNDYFEMEILKGKSISPYIHITDQVENTDRIPAGRSFFWKLFARGYSAVSYWNMNLWYQPWRKNRPERFILSDKTGYFLKKRNPYSITAGTMLYPGSSGPVASLRLHAWKDGIEDFEYLTLLQNLSKETPDAKTKKSTESLLNEIRSRFGLMKEWSSSNQQDLVLILEMRQKIASLLANQLAQIE